MDPRPLVSVVIPTFNRRDFLTDALDSVLAQTYPRTEVMVIDDGSTDGTGARVTERFPAVRYQWQENRGPSAARNHGCRLAQGEWVAFLDSDDRWQPRKLERQMGFLLENPRYEACYTDEIWIRRGVRVNPRNIHRKYSGWIFPHALPLCTISPSSILLKRSLLQSLAPGPGDGPFDESLPVCEDYDLWLRLCARHPVYFLEEKLIVKQGGHADQLSTRDWGNDRYRVRALRKVVEDRSSWFSDGQKNLAAGELAAKCRVLAQGFHKRGKTAEAALYTDLIRRLESGIDR